MDKMKSIKNAERIGFILAVIAVCIFGFFFIYNNFISNAIYKNIDDVETYSIISSVIFGLMTVGAYVCLGLSIAFTVSCIGSENNDQIKKNFTLIAVAFVIIILSATVNFFGAVLDLGELGHKH